MGFEVDKDTLAQASSTLRKTSSEIEGQASEPPQPQGGDLTEYFSATLSLLCERMGELSAAVGGVGDSVADGKTDYNVTDQNQAANLPPQ